MAENSKISWTDHTANFWWGCMKVSPGCQHCYAETLSKRYGKAIWGPASTTDREYKKAVWQDVPKWDKQAAADGVRRRVFVQSMADFFEDHPQVVQWRRDALDVMSDCTHLDFQILTKRPENIMPMLIDAGRGFQSLPDWIWIGTSVENQEQADLRIPHLLKVPAAVKFLSCEPLLGQVDLEFFDIEYPYCRSDDEPGQPAANPSRAGQLISWVIAGAESGHGARPMSLDWVRDLRDQCQAAVVPFFFKQQIVGGQKVELPALDGQVWAQFPQEVTA